MLASSQGTDLREEFFLPDGRARVRYSANGRDRESIGPYRLVSILGEGGMGAVWRARQTHPVERDVALKIALDTGNKSGLRARVEEESRTLARLSHPNIVSLLESGETENGEAYFAMELVEGTPLTTYCERNALSLNDRIEMFLEVVEGVRHAHLRGVIHRDLKPENILVRDLGEGGFIVKLIDFGIAKTFEEDRQFHTRLTMAGEVLGTPQYMSPEQATGGEIETRTDVYGLGAVLYELLTGSPALKREWFDGLSVEEVVRMIRSREPERPSVYLRSQTQAPSGGKKTPLGVQAGQWSRRIAEELDWIALRCLEKEPSQRYESASELADDLKRYLSGEPVAARAPSRVYRTRKFLIKHRGLFAVIAAVAVSLLAATSFSARWAIQATRAQDLAEARLAQVDAVPEFLFRAFRQADPSRGGADMLAIDVLRQAEKDVEVEFLDQPIVRARIQESIGETYSSLGRKDLAADTYQEALRSLGDFRDEDEQMAQRLTFLLAGAQRSSGEAERAIPVSLALWRSKEKDLGKDHAETHRVRLDYCRNLLEAAFWNDDRRAEYHEIVEATVTGVLENPGEYPTANRRSYHAVLAQLAAGRGNHEDALAFWDSAVDAGFLEGKSETAGLFWEMKFLVAALGRTGETDEAAAAAEVLLRHCRDFYGPFHPNTLSVTKKLAGIYSEQGDSKAALVLCRLSCEGGDATDELFQDSVSETHRWSRDLKLSKAETDSVERVIELVLGYPESPDLNLLLSLDLSPAILLWLGEFASGKGAHESASVLLERAHERTGEIFGAAHALAKSRGTRVAYMKIRAGDPAGAAKIILPRLKSESPGWRSGELVEVSLALADAFSGQGADEEAADLAAMLLDLYMDRGIGDPHNLNRCAALLIVPARKEGDFAELLSVMAEVEAVFHALLGPDHSATIQKRIQSAHFLVAGGQPVEAIRQVDILKTEGHAVGTRFVFLGIAKARALIALERYTEAKEVLLEAWAAGETLALQFPEPQHPAGRTALLQMSSLLSGVHTNLDDGEESQRWQEIHLKLLADESAE